MSRYDDDDEIDPIGCAFTVALVICLCGVLLKLAIAVFHWAIQK
jgi:hypothetical protein